MTEIIKNITIDVAQPNILDKVNYITAKQGDKGSRFVCAKLANESEEITVEPTSTVILNAYKPDGTRADKIGKVNPDGSVTAEITSQMLATEGQVDCDISIIDVKGTKLTTTTFYVQVQPAAIPDGSIVSSDEYSAISDLLLRVQAVDENETARQAAEVERVTENERVKMVIDSFVGDMPIANTATPGAVKSGGDITVSPTGIVTVNGLTDKAKISDVYNKSATYSRLEIDNKLTSMIQSGRISVNGWSDSGASYALRFYKTVSFGKTFVAKPTVIFSQEITSGGTGTISMSVSDVTTSAFKIRSDYNNVDVNVNWMAF